MPTQRLACFLISLIVFLLIFLLSPQDLINFPPIEVAPKPPYGVQLAIVVLFAIIFALLLFGILYSAVLALGHVVSVLIGTIFLWLSLQKTWRCMRTDNFFEKSTPAWYSPSDRHSHGTNRSTAFRDQASSPLDQDIDPIGTARRRQLYRHLNDDRGEIRLLELDEECSSGDELRYKIIQTELLSEFGKFGALSYCNGTEPATKKIWINGIDVNIRPTLFRALTSLHGQRILRHDRLWIDALCINQKDSRELGKQIVRMQRIYEDAETVIAWIDDELASANAANGHTLGPASSHDNHQPQRPPGAMEGHVFSNSYWTRLWIIQEFAANRNLQILTKDCSRQFEILWDRYTSTADPMTLTQLKELVAIRRDVDDRAKPHLLDLLIRTRPGRSGNAHDRVFSILSMAKDDRAYRVEVNYDTSEKEISIGMTRNHVKDTSTPLDLILLGPYFSEINLPTWCPNYFKFNEMPADTRLFVYVRDVLGRRSHIFKATAGSDSNVDVSNARMLATMAYHVGSIDSLGWIASDQSTSGVQSVAQPAIDTRGEDVADALQQLLLTISKIDPSGTDSYDDGPNPIDVLSSEEARTFATAYTQFSLAVFDGSVESEEVGLLDAWYARWLRMNQKFRFGECTMRQHAHNRGWILGLKRTWTLGSYKGALLANIFHTELRDWRHLNLALKAVAEKHMRLMSAQVNDNGVLGLAHADAKLGDDIFLLPGCSVPVILRGEGGADRYTLIGDAIVPGIMFGERWHDLNARGEGRKIRIY